jgi:hypothetical protein
MSVQIPQGGQQQPLDPRQKNVPGYFSIQSSLKIPVRYIRLPRDEFPILQKKLARSLATLVATLQTER